MDLETLTRYSIPVDEARLVYLQDALAEESPTLVGSANDAMMPEEGTSDGITASEVIVLNPVYQQLSQDLADTRTRLAVSWYEADLLEASIPQLQDEIYQLRQGMRFYEPAETRLDRLLDMEAHLPELSQPVTVKEPSLPQVSTSRGTIEIVAFAGILGALGGIIVIYFLVWYQSNPHDPTTRKEAGPD